MRSQQILWELQQEIDEVYLRFPWLATYLARAHLEELHVVDADPSLLESSTDTYAHMEVVYLLDGNGRCIGETGMEQRTLPPRWWRPNPKTELHSFHENIGDSVLRISREAEVFYALFVRDSVVALLYRAPKDESLTIYADTCRRKHG